MSSDNFGSTIGHGMDNPYRHATLDHQQRPAYNYDYPDAPYDAPYDAHRPPIYSAHDTTQSDLTAPQWTFSQCYDGQSYGFMCDFPASSPGRGGFREIRSACPYGYNPPAPSHVGCPPTGHLSNMGPLAPSNTHNRGVSPSQTFSQQLKSCHMTAENQLDSIQKQPQHKYQDFRGSESLFGCPLSLTLGQDHDLSPGMTTRTEGDAAFQRKQDQQWVRDFLHGREQTSTISRARYEQHSCVPKLRLALCRAVQLLSQLLKSCDSLRSHANNDAVWTNFYLIALNVKGELQDKLGILDSWGLDCRTFKLSHSAKRRARRLRAKKMQQMDEKQRGEHISEKESAIDKWRMRQIRQVEGMKMEQELKLAADAVLCEVRKKQVDVKRMQDVLRSLEKLRRLRKEAASRKGIVTKRECEEVFSSRLDQLRCVMKMRTAVYSAEEKALMVMLEGEQEEERRREQDKLVKHEKEKLIQRKQEVNAMLFGDELPADTVLQPFSEYYTQAEHSLLALLQIRREWDVFVVTMDHPDSSAVPQRWILPDTPSDHIWASALH